MPFVGATGGAFGYGRAAVATRNIVTAGIQLYLDGGTYSGSGTTWPDISGLGRNATLFNTPTFSAANGGYFNFLDTSFEYAAVPNIGSLNRWTAEVWARVGASLLGTVTSIVSNQFDLVNKLNFSLGTNNAPTSYNIAAGFYDGAWRTTAGISPSLSVWIHIVGTYDGTTIRQYTNATEANTLTYTGTPQSGGEIRIARRWDEAATTATNFFKGDVAVVRLYNRALTAAEISANYAAERGRFGV